MSLSEVSTYAGILETIKSKLTEAPSTDATAVAEDFFVYILSKSTSDTQLYAFAANKTDTNGTVTTITKNNGEDNIPESLADKITDTLKTAYNNIAGGARKSRRGGKTKKNIKRRK